MNITNLLRSQITRLSIDDILKIEDLISVERERREKSGKQNSYK